MPKTQEILARSSSFEIAETLQNDFVKNIKIVSINKKFLVKTFCIC